MTQKPVAVGRYCRRERQGDASSGERNESGVKKMGDSICEIDRKDGDREARVSLSLSFSLQSSSSRFMIVISLDDS